MPRAGVEGSTFPRGMAVPGCFNHDPERICAVTKEDTLQRRSRDQDSKTRVRFLGGAVPRCSGIRSNRSWSSEWEPWYGRSTLFGAGERRSRDPGLFNDGLKRFQDVESVSNSPTGNN